MGDLPSCELQLKPMIYEVSLPDLKIVRQGKDWITMFSKAPGVDFGRGSRVCDQPPFSQKERKKNRKVSISKSEKKQTSHYVKKATAYRYLRTSNKVVVGSCCSVLKCLNVEFKSNFTKSGPIYCFVESPSEINSTFQVILVPGR